jgi:hypothetical protein
MVATLTRELKKSLQYGGFVNNKRKSAQLIFNLINEDIEDTEPLDNGHNLVYTLTKYKSLMSRKIIRYNSTI